MKFKDVNEYSEGRYRINPRMDLNLRNQRDFTVTAPYYS